MLTHTCDDILDSSSKKKSATSIFSEGCPHCNLHLKLPVRS